MGTYIYLHGFASSPRSIKAEGLRDRFQRIGIPLQCPDLNQDDFSTLTLTRQLEQVKQLITRSASPITLIGSSFGGLTAAWLGEMIANVERLILLAPAFEFLDHWIPRLGSDTLANWERNGLLPVYHYGEQRTLPLSYTFITDLQHYPDQHLQRPVPTLILHGIHDETVPIQASQRFAEQRPWVCLKELDSDHALVDQQNTIWTLVQDGFVA
ncbi:MAG: esterase [Synechococcales cyanobacterium T60_A2020_003]|nr:esterase [Synechococcales cyanobacterium T60_A2020_003]